MKKFIFLTSMLLGSGFIYSADVPIVSFNIESLRLSDSTGTLYIKPAAKIEIKNDTCGNADLYAISSDDSLFNQMYSMLLAAGNSGKKVRIWLSDIPNDCQRGRQRVRLVEVSF